MEKIKEYLNEAEHNAIEKFVENKILLEAVKKVLLEPVYTQGILKEGQPAKPDTNYAFALAARRKMTGFTHLTNEQIGADLCAVWEGINLVGLGFNELEKFKKKGEPDKPKENPGRWLADN